MEAARTSIVTLDGNAAYLNKERHKALKIFRIKNQGLLSKSDKDLGVGCINAMEGIAAPLNEYRTDFLLQNSKSL